MTVCRLVLASFVVLAVSILGSSVEAVPLQFEIVSSARTVDISTHLTKITTKLELENVGGTSASHVYLSTEPRMVEKLSFLSVSDDGLDSDALDVSQMKEGANVLHKVALPKTCASSGRVKVSF